MKLIKSKEPTTTSSSSTTLLVDLFHSQTKQIVSAVLTLTRQNEIDNNNITTGQTLRYTRSLSPINDKEQMQLVKNVAIAVRDLLQTLDYAPAAIKELVENISKFSFFF